MLSSHKHPRHLKFTRLQNNRRQCRSISFEYTFYILIALNIFQLFKIQIQLPEQATKYKMGSFHSIADHKNTHKTLETKEIPEKPEIPLKILENDREKTTNPKLVDPEKQNQIRTSTLFAWNSYKKHCWGHDELLPVTQKCSDTMKQSLTIVDSLDTLSIMGFEEEFNEGIAYLLENEHFESDAVVRVFETIIRSLGGLLSIYEISKDEQVLKRAVLLAERLWPAYEKSVMPYPEINLKSGRVHEISWNRGKAFVSEVGTIQLEFSRLSYYTKDRKYVDKSNEIIEKIRIAQTFYKGLAPAEFRFDGDFERKAGTSGGVGGYYDSYYEYLLKRWLLTGKTEELFREMYVESANAILEQLGRTSSQGFFYIGNLKNGKLSDELEHLGCFYAGALALGVHSGAVTGEDAEKHLTAAKNLGDTCYEMYRMTETGLGLDKVGFSSKGMKPLNKQYILRPEVVESMFVLWRVTHDQKWRDNAWKIYESIERHCRTDNGYASIDDVLTGRKRRDGKMESFLLAETFKYLYLIFGEDSEVSLDKFVFNTEAHPLRVIETQIQLHSSIVLSIKSADSY